ncbi:hypothetical protein RINTHH_14640 [Richelia intracellularis HH01]|uniref:Uncharacterized protein n=1 Tax=Richelia intracellularis HH01 TaxID=1165094 RepID=M1WSS6_9NOST|nr:hypothetical protein RINTHH_14640 [Richelia intracellularis HH01]
MYWLPYQYLLLYMTLFYFSLVIISILLVNQTMLLMFLYLNLGLS